MTKVKICGMRRASDIEIASRAEYLGFVVGSSSVRNLEIGRAKELMSLTDNRKVAVTTAADPMALVHLSNELEPDVLQVHSILGTATLELLSEELSVPIWGLVQVGGGDEEDRLSRIHGIVDAVVLDTKSAMLGGQGKVHDWAISRRVADTARPLPVVLAGGLTPENVEEAVRTVRPCCVDVSSGVERHGAKDLALTERFIERARGAED